MGNCLHLRPQAKARIQLHNVRHNLLGTITNLHRHKTIAANTESLIKPARQHAFAAHQADEGKADTIIKNAGLILDPGDSDTQADCIAIQGKTIVRVGSWEQVSPLAGQDTEVIDAQGKTVLPGLCDAHVHLLVGAERSQGVDVEDVRSLEEFKRRVGGFAAAHPDLPCIHVYGLHYTDPPLIPAATARHVLDEIVQDRPLFVYAHDLHTGWANTLAIQESGLLTTMPPYPRLIQELHLEANIELDQEGRPAGEFREPDVYFLIEGPMREKHPLGFERKLEYLRDVLAQLSALGLTSIHNMGLALPEEDIELLILLLELEQRGELPLKVYLAYSIVPDEHMLTDVAHAADIRDTLHQARKGRISARKLQRFLAETMVEVSNLRHEHDLSVAHRHPHLREHADLPFLHEISRSLHAHIQAVHARLHLERARSLPEDAQQDEQASLLDEQGKVDLGGVKIFMDGVVEKDTAYRLDQQPLPGIPPFSPEHLRLVVAASDRAGLQVAGHCIGDASVRAILDAVAAARKENAAIDAERGHQIRHRIEHIEMCAPEDLDRFAGLNVTPSMQPLHERPPETMWHQKVPEEQWATAFAWKTLLNTGAKLCFGSDWPIVSCNCFAGMERAVNRKPWKNGMPDQHLTSDEVVRNFTAHPAFLEYREQCKGRLRSGMAADLVILTENLEDVPSNELAKIGIHLVMSDGVRIPATP
jgi:predicted amidohydrolase YtcJ